MVVGVCLVHVMVWCGPVRRVGWVACGDRLRWGVVVMQLVGVAVVLGHHGVGVRGVRRLLVVPRTLALREWWSLCGPHFLHAVVPGRAAGLGCRGTAVVVGAGEGVAAGLPWDSGSGVVRCGWAWVPVGVLSPVGGRAGGPLGLSWPSWPGRCQGWVNPPVAMGVTGRGSDVGALVCRVDLCGGGYTGGGGVGVLKRRPALRGPQLWWWGGMCRVEESVGCSFLMPEAVLNRRQV